MLDALGPSCPPSLLLVGTSAPHGADSSTLSLLAARMPAVPLIGELGSGWLAGWLAGWMVGWMVGWMGGWMGGLIGWLTGL